MSIKSVTVEYDPSTVRGGFSRGETLTGRVRLDLDKDTKVQCVSVRAKGKASVFWTEHHIYAVVSYKAKQHFFSINQILLEQSKPESKLLSAGSHVFPFVFHIPDVDLPQDWAGRHGHIAYSLEARASRSWRLDRKVRSPIFMRESEDHDYGLDVTKPQRGQDERKGLFSSGRMALSVSTERTGYQPGEALEVTAHITNNSKDTKATPTYVFYQKQTFLCKKKRKVHTRHILQEKSHAVQPGQEVTHTKVLQIPHTLHATFLNGRIVQQEYRLQVHLDGPLYSPVVKLPIVVLPKSVGGKQDE